MRVISWNMGLARPNFQEVGLHDQAWHYLLGLGPDIAFLQESLPPNWVRGEGTLVHGPFRRWGSVLFSPRYPLQPLRLPDGHHLRQLGTYLAFGVAPIPDGTDVLVASVHARGAFATPTHLRGVDLSLAKRASGGRPLTNDVVFAGLAGLVRDRSSFLIVGDWNTARNQGSKYKDRAGLAFFDRAAEHGWFDCVRKIKHEGEIRTWFGPGKLVQDDHAFCDGELGKQLRDAWAAADAPGPYLKLSDHAPLILDFDVAPISMRALHGVDACT